MYTTSLRSSHCKRGCKLPRTPGQELRPIKIPGKIPRPAPNPDVVPDRLFLGGHGLTWSGIAATKKTHHGDTEYTENSPLRLRVLRASVVKICLPKWQEFSPCRKEIMIGFGNL